MSVKDADGHKLSLYPREVSRVLDGDLDHSLLQVEIGPTNACNHHCNYCTLPDWLERDGSYIDKDAMLRALDDMAEMGVLGVYFAGEGEPLMHKDFPEFVKKASELEMGVSLSTNGALLTEEVSEKILPYLSWMRIGIDAATPETYSLIHGVPERNFHTTIENLTNATRIKRENDYLVDIGVQALLLPENASEMVELTKIVKDSGANNFQIKPFAQHPFAHTRTKLVDYDDLKSQGLREKVESFEDEEFKVVYREQSMRRVAEPAANYTECLGLNFWTLIDAKGNVIPCNPCYDKPGLSFGNINEQSFKEIWEGDKRKEVQKDLKRTDCKVYRCRPDIFNRHMWRLNNPELNDCFI